MNVTDTRAITSVVTVGRTSSLRDQFRPTMPEDPSLADLGYLSLNKRSLSNDKITTDSMTPVFIPQRGNSLRQNGKSVLPMSSPNSSNRHPFKIIKPIDTSPRASESNIDLDTNSSLKVSSQRLKIKHRSQLPSQGGPLIPDHSLMKEPSRDNIHFTPRPPLVKKFSSDQDDPSSDIDGSQPIKSSRYYQICSATAPARPPMSPTRGIVQATKSVNNAITNSIESCDKPRDPSDEDTSELEDNHNSDCETPPPSNCPPEIATSTKQRSSLRKGSDSPNHSDGPGRNSPSPTKTVKWNMNTEVKKIPRSRSLNGKFKCPKSRSHRSASDRSTQLSFCDQKLVESHESYISRCTTLIRNQMSLLENIRTDKISVPHYKKDLTDLLDSQLKLIVNLQTTLASVMSEAEKSIPIL